MSITIDTETLHKWALDNGYVPLKAISDYAKKHFTSIVIDEVDPRLNGKDPVVYGKLAPVETAFQAAEEVMARRREALADPAMDDLAALENLDDLKPVDPFPTEKEVGDALRALIASYGGEALTKGNEAAKTLLAGFGAAGISKVPPDRRREFIAAAERAKS